MIIQLLRSVKLPHMILAKKERNFSLIPLDSHTPIFRTQKKSHRSVQTKPSSSRPNNRTNKQGADFLTPQQRHRRLQEKIHTHTHESALTHSLTLVDAATVDRRRRDRFQTERAQLATRRSTRTVVCGFSLTLSCARPFFLSLYYYFSGVFHPP